MSTLDTVFFAVLVAVLLLDLVWRLCTDAPHGAPTTWLVPPWLLVVPLGLGALLIETHPVAFVCTALVVHRAWAAVLRVAPDEDAQGAVRP